MSRFAFEFYLPPDLCVSSFEPLAMIRHFVVATAVGSAKGLFGKDLTAEEMVYAIAGPAQPEGQFVYGAHARSFEMMTFTSPLSVSRPDGSDLLFDHHSTGYLDSLGPWSIDASSSLFTVAGGVFLSLTFASPPPNLRIYAVKMFVDQTVELTSFRNPAKTGTLRKRQVVLERGWDGPPTQAALNRLRRGGTEKDAILFDASETGNGDDGGWTLEDVGRIVSRSPGFFPLTRQQD